MVKTHIIKFAISARCQCMGSGVEYTGVAEQLFPGTYSSCETDTRCSYTHLCVGPPTVIFLLTLFLVPF